MLAPTTMLRRALPALVASLLTAACGASPANGPSEPPPVVIAAPTPAAPEPAASAENEPDPEAESAPVEPAPPAPAPAPTPAPSTAYYSPFAAAPPIVYQTGSDQLKPESLPTLFRVVAEMQAASDITLFRIEVHTDSQGDDRANQVLSEKRALTVARWLVANGIDCKRLIAVGFGENKPIAPNDTAEGRAKNRRTEFVGAARNGKPFGGMPIDGGGKIAGDACR